MENDVTAQGRQHIDRWLRATENLASANKAVSSAECEVANATTALGKWLLPEDAKIDEQFCVWFGDSLIAAVRPNATLPGGSEYIVTIRKHGKSLRK